MKKRLSKSHKEAISRALTGRKLSPEHVQRVAESNKIPKPWVSEALTGRKKSELHKHNLRVSMLKRQEQLRNYETDFKHDDEKPFFGIITDGLEDDEYTW